MSQPRASTWPKAVFFDFDGVVVNSEPLHFRAFQEVLASNHVELTEDEYYRDLIGFDDRGAFRHLYESRGLPLMPRTFLSLMAQKSEKMQSLIDSGQFSALPGVEAFVRLLWRRCSLAICSGALREEIEGMLQAISLRDCFPIIVAAEDVTVGKPDPQGYLLTLKLMSERTGERLQPADCLIIEDAPTVIASVRAAGFPVLGVASTYPPEKLSGANWVVKSLEPGEVARAAPQLKIEV